MIYHDTDTNCKALGFLTEYCCFCRNGRSDFFALSSRDVPVCFGGEMLFISFYLGNYMTGLVPFKVLILVSNERGFVQQQRFLLYLDIVLRIQDRKHKSALNLFCHLSEAVEVQGTFVFPGAGLRCSCQFQCASWAGFSTAAEVGHSGARRCGPAQTSCSRSDLEMGGRCTLSWRVPESLGAGLCRHSERAVRRTSGQGISSWWYSRLMGCVTNSKPLLREPSCLQ